MERKKHTIDASGKALGRLAVEISVLLRGKNRPDFEPHLDNGDFVIVKNINKIKIIPQRQETKIYRHHSGYLGGLKEISLKNLFTKKPSKVLWFAVYGMLPKTRLRAKQIRRLKFEK